MKDQTKTDNEIITAELVNGGDYTSHAGFACHACGEVTDERIVAEVKTPGQYHAFRVCDYCLEAGEEGLKQRMAAHASHMEACAAELRSLIGRLKVPTYQDWMKATSLFRKAINQCTTEGEWEKIMENAPWKTSCAYDAVVGIDQPPNDDDPF